MGTGAVSSYARSRHMLRRPKNITGRKRGDRRTLWQPMSIRALQETTGSRTRAGSQLRLVRTCMILCGWKEPRIIWHCRVVSSLGASLKLQGPETQKCKDRVRVKKTAVEAGQLRRTLP